MDDLNGKVVVVTGGATGIGFALAKALGAKGAKIVIGEPREERLQSSVEELTSLGVKATYFVCDVTDINQVEALADHAWNTYGQVDFVFNNAGISQSISSIVDAPLEDLTKVFDVNLYGVLHGMKVFGRRLIDQGTPASIYNTGSENSFFVAVQNSAAYVASKHAVYGLTDAFREEVPDYMTVGMIAPGFVGSEMVPEGFREMGMSPDEYAAIVVPQVLAGEPMVVSHGYNQVRIEDRRKVLDHAYKTYAPFKDGDEKYDVQILLEQLSGQ